jgi:catechol-2,3-dioxygenase
MNIRSIKLATVDLGRLKTFYAETFGLPLVADTADNFTVQAGTSTLQFMDVADASLGRPYYHFAFDIADTRLPSAKRWLESKGLKLSLFGDGRDEFYSLRWDATSVYFHDPAGNIVEFIARRHAEIDAAASPFEAGDIRSISEIGMSVDDVAGTVALLQSRFGLTGYQGYDEQFAPVGTKEGLLIVTKRGRIWLGSKQEGHVFPTEVAIEGEREGELAWNEYPYRILSRRADAYAGRGQS